MFARVEAQTIDDIGLAFRRLLAAHPGPPGRDRVRLLLEQALGDRESHPGYEIV